jgi:hypothetical protein
MAKVKIRWKVAEAPTGPYRSFSFRGWPTAHYQNESQNICGDIQCKDDYTPFRAKSGNHAPLTVRVCDHSTSPLNWLTLKVQCTTITDAKAALAAYIDRHPEVMPAEYRQPATAATKSAAGSSEHANEFIHVRKDMDRTREGSCNACTPATQTEEYTKVVEIQLRGHNIRLCPACAKTLKLSL